MHNIFATIEQAGRIYTNQTGRFPVTSSLGNKYVMIFYNYDTNAILAQPLKNQRGVEILNACQKLQDIKKIRVSNHSIGLKMKHPMQWRNTTC